TRRVNEDDRVVLLHQVPLEQQRNHADDDLVAPLLRPGNLAISKSGDAWMHDPVQRVELVLIREDDLTEGSAVETSILLKNVFAPPLDDILQSLCLGTHSLAREHVRVNERGATLGQHSRHL